MWDILDFLPYSNGDFVLTARLFTSDEGCFYNEFDTEKIYSDGYSYLMNYKNNAISQAEYEAYLADYGLDDYNTDESNYQMIDESDVYSITSKVIKEKFACKD